MTGTPAVSILMAARNTAPFVGAAIHSARMQTFTDIEIVVVDDGSHDETKEIASAHARADPRVRLIDGPGKGLSAVRNTSLQTARGRLVAILDSDDILHPDHIDHLMRFQARSGARICATNMVQFALDGAVVRADAFAGGAAWQKARGIDAELFVRGGMIGTSEVSLGYLKPMFDREFLSSRGLEYDERLRIGEDFDLALRAMLAGADYHFLPQSTYYYRRHPGSTSHRLTPDDLAGLIHATRAYTAQGGALRRLMATRLANLEGSLCQVQALNAMKKGRLLKGLRFALPHREARRLTCVSLGESLRKRLGVYHPKVAPADNSGLSAEHVQAISRTLGLSRPFSLTET